MKKYDLDKKDANVLERISKNKLILSRVKDHWEYEHKRNELYSQAIKALETDNGAEAFKRHITRRKRISSSM